MTLPAYARGRALTSTPGRWAAARALDRLSETPRQRCVRRQLPPDFAKRGPRIPDGAHEGSAHLQGMALVGRRLFLTTTAGRGQVISAIKGAGGDYYVDREAVGLGRPCHPGGMQAVGRYLAIPIYDDDSSQVEIRDASQAQLPLVRRLRLGRKGYCLGITTTADARGEFYLLAVVTQSAGMRVELYRTPSGLPLRDPACLFELIKVVETDKRPERPERDWNGYPNNVALLRDDRQRVCFLGLYKSELLGGQDWADLYRVDLEAPEAATFTRLSRFHARCSPAPAFRWGAGAAVTADDAITLFACERNVRDGNSRIHVDVFESAAPA